MTDHAASLPSQPHAPGSPPLFEQFPGTARKLRLQLWECHQRISELEAEVERLEDIHNGYWFREATFQRERAEAAESRIDQLLRDLAQIEEYVQHNFFEMTRLHLVNMVRAAQRGDTP